MCSNVPVTADTTVFNWAPNSEDATTDARIKVVFKNRFTDRTAEAINPDPIAFLEHAIKYEDLLYPENGEVFVVGDTCSVEWANFMIRISIA